MLFLHAIRTRGLLQGSLARTKHIENGVCKELKREERARAQIAQAAVFK
jgi:hypothetical protein